MASARASVPTQASLPVKFHPPKSFRFPKRKFGTKTERLFRAEWCGGVRTILSMAPLRRRYQLGLLSPLYDSSI